MSPTTVSSPAPPIPSLAFRDFDRESVFKNIEEHFLNPDALNLVIEFDNSTARAAIDLDDEKVKEVLNAEVRHYPGNP